MRAIYTVMYVYVYGVCRSQMSLSPELGVPRRYTPGLSELRVIQEINVIMGRICLVFVELKNKSNLSLVMYCAL